LALTLAVTLSGGCRRRGSRLPTPEAAVAALSDPNPDRRKDAAEMLRDDGGPPGSAVPALLAAEARETDPEAREQILITLGASGAPEARPALEAAMRDPERDVRKGAERGLHLWGKKSGHSSPEQLARIAALKSPDWEARREAADDLRDDGGPPADAIPALLEAARTKTHPKALGAMLLTLGESGAPTAKAPILASLQAADQDLRRYAQKAHKLWLLRNGEQLRKDVETATAAAASGGSDGCEQFKQICGADPFDLARCRGDMQPLSYKQQVAWAECVNA
jgi:hypothetical protein